jgi:glycosyltransferase involved in cell wall biosynthesis
VFTSPLLPALLLDEKATAGGAEVQLRAIGRQLGFAGWDVSFVVSDCGQDDVVVNRDGFTIYKSYRPEARIRAPGVDLFATKMPQLAAAMRRANADVYINRAAGWATGHGCRVAHVLRRKFAFWMASRNDLMLGPERWPMPLHIRLMYEHGLRHADLIIAQTEEQRELLQQVRRLRSVIMPNLCASPAGPFTKSEHPTVLWVGNIRPLKRPGMLLEVARQLPQHRFVAVGTPLPALEADYDEFAKGAAQLPNVHVMGAVSSTEMPAHYASAWVLLSTSEVEGFSNVFLEAWANATPVVAMLDPDEVICRYRLGYHCSTVEELVQRVGEICEDASMRDELGANAREYVREHHDPGAVGARLDRELRRLIGLA